MTASRTLKGWQKSALVALAVRGSARLTSKTTYTNGDHMSLNWRMARLFEQLGFAASAGDSSVAITEAGTLEAKRLEQEEGVRP